MPPLIRPFYGAHAAIAVDEGFAVRQTNWQKLAILLKNQLLKNQLLKKIFSQ
jgi:hypothetical protein